MLQREDRYKRRERERERKKEREREREREKGRESDRKTKRMQVGKIGTSIENYLIAHTHLNCHRTYCKYSNQ